MELNFVIDQENLKNYKPVADYIPISAPSAYLRMGQDATKQANFNYSSSDPRHFWSPIYVDTVVEPRYIKKWFCGEHWWRIRCNHPSHLFLMALDCDGEQDMLSAARILKMQNIGYAVVKTSTGNETHVITGYQQLVVPVGPQGVQGPYGPQYLPTPIAEIQKTDHFWLITDYIAPVKHLINFMKTIYIMQ